jgi:hypothetical protein
LTKIGKRTKRNALPRVFFGVPISCLRYWLVFERSGVDLYHRNVGFDVDLLSKPVCVCSLRFGSAMSRSTKRFAMVGCVSMGLVVTYAAFRSCSRSTGSLQQVASRSGDDFAVE